MKIKENYKVREIAGENLIVEQGKSQSDMTKVISLNNTALLLWKELQGREFSLEDAAEVLMNHYGISKDQALVDAQKWVDALGNCGIIGLFFPVTFTGEILIVCYNSLHIMR